MIWSLWNIVLSPSAFVKMKFISVAAAVLPLASGAMFSKEEYTSGAVMAMMMEAKEVRQTL